MSNMETFFDAAWSTVDPTVPASQRQEADRYPGTWDPSEAEAAEAAVDDYFWQDALGARGWSWKRILADARSKMPGTRIHGLKVVGKDRAYAKVEKDGAKGWITFEPKIVLAKAGHVYRRPAPVAFLLQEPTAFGGADPDDYFWEDALGASVAPRGVRSHRASTRDVARLVANRSGKVVDARTVYADNPDDAAWKGALSYRGDLSRKAVAARKTAKKGASKQAKEAGRRLAKGYSNQMMKLQRGETHAYPAHAGGPHAGYKNTYKVFMVESFGGAADPDALGGVKMHHYEQEGRRVMNRVLRLRRRGRTIGHPVNPHARGSWQAEAWDRGIEDAKKAAKAGATAFGAATNGEGLTYPEWLAAANFGRNNRWYSSSATRKAWRNSEDPTDWAAFPDNRAVMTKALKVQR